MLRSCFRYIVYMKTIVQDKLIIIIEISVKINNFKLYIDF